MRTKQSYEREIERLRQRHGELFKQGKFGEMETVSRKIRDCWAAWHRLDEKEKPQIRQTGSAEAFVGSIATGR